MNNALNPNSVKLMKKSSYIFFIIALLLIGRFAYISIGKELGGFNLKDFANNLYYREREIPASRGNIYDRNGNILALDLDSYIVYAIVSEKYPNHVTDKEGTAIKLSEILECSKDEIYDYLNTENVFQVEFGTCGKINSIQKKEIESLELPGIDFFVGKKRYYPNEAFLSHTLGYVQVDNNENMTGYLGIEEYFDDILNGTNGLLTYRADIGGYKFKDSVVKSQDAKDGNDIYLTIDTTIQMILEDVVSEVQLEYEPEEIVAVVSDAKTGAIYAISNRPTFNPNIKDIDYFYNNAISNPYEPGSIAKPYVYATAIDLGVYKGNDTYMSGEIMIGDIKITDYNDVGWGRITFNEGLYHSSNVGIVNLLLDYIAPVDYLQYLNKFGFGKVTGVDLPNEAKGDIEVDSYFTSITAGFGQGILTTPLQHIQAFSAFVNNGEMVKPQIIDKIVNPNTDEVVYNFEREVAGKPIKPDTAEAMRNLLIETVNNEVAVAKNYALDNFLVMGKSGTAQIADPSGGYIKGEYYHSFIGAAPANDPKLIVYVGVKQPKKDGVYSSKIFKTAMKNSLIYLGHNDSDVDYDDKEIINLENYIGKDINVVESDLKELGLEPIIIGNGDEVIAQSPRKGIPVVRGNKVILQTSNTITMPDIVGWSLNDVILLKDILDIDIITNGHGYVRRSNIPPGQELRPEDKILIDLLP